MPSQNVRGELKEVELPRGQWATMGNSPLMVEYHDKKWGVPVHNDRTLFEFLALEGAQAGLSWQTILNKRETYRKTFHNFDIARVARYNNRNVQRLLQDPGIVRNGLKIGATINNASKSCKYRRNSILSTNTCADSWAEDPSITNSLRSARFLQPPANPTL